jgi:uncharacterized protein YjbI with pentapeptide repeats
MMGSKSYTGKIRRECKSVVCPKCGVCVFKFSPPIERAKPVGRDLSGADLANANLQGEDLRYAVLTNAD